MAARARECYPKESHPGGTPAETGGTCHTSGMKLTGIKYMLVAADMDRAIGFYRDAFGLTPGYTSPDWSELSWGDTIIALHGGGTNERNITGLSFRVDDIREAVDVAVGAGATLVSGPTDQGDEGILLADLIDSEGNTFMLSQDKF